MNRRKFFNLILGGALAISSTASDVNRKLTTTFLLNNYAAVKRITKKYADEYDHLPPIQNSRILSPEECNRRIEYLTQMVSDYLGFSLTPITPFYVDEQKQTGLFKLDLFKTFGVEEKDLERSAFYIPATIKIVAVDRQADRFDAIYGHEMAHYAISAKDSERKLGIAVYNVLRRVGMKEVSFEDLRKSGFARAINEGIAREIQERIAREVAKNTGNPNVLKEALNFTFTDLIPIYAYVENLNGKRPDPTITHVRDYEDLRKDYFLKWDAHFAGTAIVKLMQLENPNAYRDLFNGDVSGLERLIK